MKNGLKVNRHHSNQWSSSLVVEYAGFFIEQIHMLNTRKGRNMKEIVLQNLLSSVVWIIVLGILAATVKSFRWGDVGC
jgi:uncharacterized membrane protein